MSDKNTFRRTTTRTTRSWAVLNDLTPEQRANITEMMEDGEIDGASVTQKWHEAGTGQDDFDAEIKNGVVTVNGRRYNSLAEVPTEDRQRIEALRASMKEGGSLRDMLERVTAEAEHKALGGERADAAHEAAVPGAAVPGMTDTTFYSSSDSPGAVPVVGTGRRIGQILLAVVGIGVLWLIARTLNLV